MYESGLVKSMAQTQDLTIYRQLTCGIRYFDLRPQWSDGKISMHHGPVLGPEVGQRVGRRAAVLPRRSGRIAN